jgi:hypothetical protein
LLAFPADLDSSRYFQDHNVKAQVRGLNLQHKPSSFPIFELLLMESAEHNPRNFTAASRTPPGPAAGWGCRGRHLSRR